MNDYYSVRINCSPCSEDCTDFLAAFLADYGYESFEPDDSGLAAYIPAGSFKETDLADLVSDFPMECNLDISWEFVEGKDWNEEWEKNYFKPILIGDRCVIHSTFHKDVPKAEYDISVDPRMAFGTGHHSTTRLMITSILNRDLRGRKVIDMGTGTGILSILAAKKGAESVFAVEIDPFAAENAEENFRLNSVKVNLKVGDVSCLADFPKADLFLANINRNIILSDIEDYSDSILPGGEILLSGFFENDAESIIRMGRVYGLEYNDISVDDKWALLSLKKQDNIL